MSEIRDPENPLEGMTPAIGEPIPEPMRPPWYNGLPDASNPYAARLREKPDLGVISNAQRALLNAKDSFYTGTLTGSVYLKNLADVAAADVQPGGYVTQAMKEHAQVELERIREDKARYESVPSFSGPMEAAAAFGGQLAGGIASPESWITSFPGAKWAVGKVFGEAANTVASRIVESGLSQAAINVVTDPLAQAGSLITGLQQKYDYWRTFLVAPTVGAIFGGAFQGGAEAARAFRGPAAAVPGVPRETTPEMGWRERRVMGLAPGETAVAGAPAEPPTPAGPVQSATPDMPVAAAVQDPNIRIEPGSAAADAARQTHPSTLPLPVSESNVAGRVVSGDENLFQVARIEEDVSRIAATLENPHVEGTSAYAERDQLNRETARSVLIPDQPTAEALARPTETNIVLKETTPNPEHYPNLHEIDIETRAGQPIASGEVGIVDGGKTAKIAFIRAGGREAERGAVFEGANELGPRMIRDIARQFFLDHPEIEKIVGQRISGARRAGKTMADEWDPRGEITITRQQALAGPTVAPTGAQPGLVFGGPSGSRAAPPAAAAGAPPVAPGEIIRSLQQQSFDLAEALNIPLRQGRVQRRQASGQYDVGQDVIRTGSVADFKTVAHEAGHGLERHVGGELKNLMNRHAAELGPLDYDPAQARVAEGFAEWVSHYLTAPQAAQKEAPAFYAAFREFMRREQPAMFASIEQAQAGYQRYLAAPSGTRLDAIVQRTAADTLYNRLRSQKFATTISMMLSKSNEMILDRNAPVVRAIRAMATEAYRASGVRMRLTGRRDPEKMVRLAVRSWQAAHDGLMNGIVPHGGGTPSVSLRDALITANGQRGLFGTWDDVRLKAFDDYLVARQAEIDWERYHLGDLPNEPIALHQVDVAQAIQQHEASYPTFRAAAQQVQEFLRALIKKELDAGLMTQELYNKLLQQKFYVPLYRVMDDKPLAAAAPTSGAARSEGPGMVDLIKQKRGSDRDIIAPTQSIIAQVNLAERAIAHNDTVKALVGLARDSIKLGATGIGRILEELSPHQLVGKRFDLREAIEAAGRQNGLNPNDIAHMQTAVIDVFGEDPLLGTIFRNAPTGKRGEPIMFWKEGGELRAVRLISEAENLGLYEALTGLPTQMRDIAFKWIAASSSALRIGITTDPAYAFANFLRDQLGAAIYEPGYIPLNPTGIFRALSGDRWAQMYSRYGGLNPGPASIELDKAIARDIESLKRKGWLIKEFGAISDLFHPSRAGGVGSAVAGLGRAITEVIGLAESGTRINIFKRVFQQKKRQGLSDEDAGMEAAQTATDLFDMSRHGSRTLEIRNIWMFLNSNLQGMSKMGRHMFVPLYRAATGNMVLQNDVEAFKKAGLSWLVFGGVNSALGFAYGLWASKYEPYQDANNRMRATNVIVPGAAFGYPGVIGTAPKPFELSIGFNLGEQAAIDVAKGDPRVYENALTGILEVISPPNLLHFIPGLSTAAELLLNRSFFTGRSLVNDELQAVEPFAQYTPQTSTVAKWAGKQVNVSPIKLEHWVGNSFGSWGRDLIHAADGLDPNRPDLPPENTMFLRRFLKSADIASQTTETFWRFASTQNGEFVQANKTYKTFVDAQREREALEYLSQLPADKRAYTTLQSAAKEDGKPKFDAEEKKLHPLTRAGAAIKVISGFIDELNINTQREIAANETLSMNATERREAIDGLRLIQAMEQRNALVMLNQRGYEGRQVLSVEDQFAVLRDQVPKVASELADRYASAKIYKTDEIAKAWPQAQRRLLREGSEADLKDLALDVRSEGVAFEGNRVRGANRRRMLLIPPGMEQEGARP